MKQRHGVVSFAVVGVVLLWILGAPVLADALAEVVNDMLSQVSESKLYSTVLTLQKNFGYNTRYTWSKPAIDRAARYIHDDELAAYGLDDFGYHAYYYPPFPTVRYNVVGQIDGTVYPNRIYVVCAHYDSISETPYTWAPGAEDNASGVAGVLECARITAQADCDFECTIRFLLFSGEEQGAWGSWHYVEDYIADDPGHGFQGVINLDMIAYKSKDPEDLDITEVANDYGEFVWSIGHHIGHYVPQLPYRHRPGSGLISDDYCFAINGIPAVTFIDEVDAGFHPVYPWYHTGEDTIDKLDFGLCADITRAALASTACMAGAYTLWAEPPDDWLWPHWNWISIPVVPVHPQPEEVLDMNCRGRLWTWDVYEKGSIAYNPPFSEFHFVVGKSYLLKVDEAPQPGPFTANMPDFPVEVKLGRMGWAWVGLPGLTPLGGSAFMNSVCVKYPQDESGEVRTAQQDYDATPKNWVNWAWPFWDAHGQFARCFTPYAPFGNRTCYPWVGYRIWANVGTAPDPDDPDQVTLIWP